MQKYFFCNRAVERLKSDIELDASGLVCPEPLMLVRNRVREMQGGQVLHVLATDPTTQRDLEQFCRFMRHDMVDFVVSGNRLEFWIRKG